MLRTSLKIIVVLIVASDFEKRMIFKSLYKRGNFKNRSSLLRTLLDIVFLNYFLLIFENSKNSQI